ncbi:MAG: lectin-like protein, partial [Flavobacteriales bacterium]
ENVGDLSVWIGFTDEAEEGNWQWITGEEVTYTNWGANEPDGGEVENGCELVSDGTWNDQNVNSLRQFVFEVEVDTTGGGDYFIEGIVRDFDGNPIPDVSVTAFVEENSWTSNSDEEGYYHIDNDSLNGLVAIWCSGNDEYWHDLTTVDVSEGGNQFDFSLGLQEETANLVVYTITTNWDPVSFAEVHSPQSPQEMSNSDMY